MPSPRASHTKRTHQNANSTTEGLQDITMCDRPRLDIEEEHDSMYYVRKALRRYQHQSPDRFELHIETHQCGVATRTNQWENEPTTYVLCVLFEGRTIEGIVTLQTTCRVQVHMHRLKSPLSVRILVTHNNTPRSLEEFLDSTFPVFGMTLDRDTMYNWWQANGKSFNWTNLPTELKEHIIECCMHHQIPQGSYNNKLINYQRRHRVLRPTRKPGPFEIVAQLSDWYQLLYVSHQVRAVTLRLCLIGSRRLTGSVNSGSPGLCIIAKTYTDFQESIHRLESYYQMIEGNGIPQKASEVAQADHYKHYPRIYPEHKRFATLCHGIQKISLGMDFVSSMHFFEVEVGNFQRHNGVSGLTYRVFERLPNLNEIVIRLPLRPRTGWMNPLHARGPPLFHELEPCPGKLHRVIYERIAVALAEYELVEVRNFIFESEEQRFLKKRAEARKARKFTKKELEELYADDRGGVEVPQDECASEGVELGREAVDEQSLDGPFDTFFPPICQCNTPCCSVIQDSSRF